MNNPTILAPHLTEFSTPASVDITDDLTINSMLRERFESDPHGTLFKRKTILGDTWVRLTVAEFYDQVVEVAKGFTALGIKAGDVVATMSRTRYELSVLDFALWALGAVHVLIYETSSVLQAQHIIKDAKVKLVVAENNSLRALLNQAIDPKRVHKEIFVLDNNGINKIIYAGRNIPVQDIYKSANEVKGGDLATIIYTSGTTGTPKGVEITHTNLYSVVTNGTESPELNQYVSTPNKSTLLFLPMAHVFARFVSLIPIYSRCIIGHAPGAQNLVADLQSFKPTFLLVVPRVLEKVYNSADQKMGHGFKQKLFRLAARTAEAYARHHLAHKGITPLLRAQWHGYEKLVYSKITALMGGKLELLISGGAPMGDRLGHFYTGLGLKVLEGYGLTETAAPITVNPQSKVKIGTVGTAYPGNTIRISAEGEIQVKGPQIFRGYHNLPEQTAQAFDGPWFKTGDVGEIDEDGYLRITGRAKELIVTAGGKNVAPAILEDMLRGHPLISQVVVVGDQRPFVSALITLDQDMLPGWLRNHGIEQMPVTEAAENPQVLAALDRAVKRTNATVSRAESIRKFTVLPTDFTEYNGFITPSLKVRRRQVLEAFQEEVEAMYTVKKVK